MSLTVMEDVCILEVDQYTNEELVVLYREGNSYAADILWQQNLGLTNKFISKQQVFNYFYYDDLLHMAHLAFTRSLKYYDVNRGFKFTALYGKAFNMEVSSEIVKSRRPKRNGSTVSLDAKFGMTEESTLHNMMTYEIDYSKTEIDLEEINQSIQYSLALIKPIYHSYILEYLTDEYRPSYRELALRITEETGEHKTQQVVSKTMENFRKYAKDYIFYSENKRSRIAEMKCTLTR